MSSETLFGNKVIIFGNDHLNTLGLIRSFGECGICTYTVLYGCGDQAKVSKSKYIGKTYYFSTAEDGLDFILNNFKHESLKPFLFFPNDKIAELVDSHYEKLRTDFILQNAGGQNALKRYFEKINQTEIAVRYGFNVPNTSVCHRHSIEYIKQVYPCIIKPAKSIDGTKSDITICCDEKELRKAISMLSPVCHSILIQEYIEKEYEVCILGVALNKEVVIPGIVRKYRDDPSVVGSTAYAALESIPAELDIEPIINSIKGIGYKGLFSVELIFSKGKFYFIEFNFRNDANGYLLSSAGANLPLLFCLDQLNIGRDYIIPKMPYYSMSISDVQNIRRGRVSLCQWLKDYHCTNCFMQCSNTDPEPWGKRGRMVIFALKAKLLHFLGL